MDYSVELLHWLPHEELERLEAARLLEMREFRRWAFEYKDSSFCGIKLATSMVRVMLVYARGVCRLPPKVRPSLAVMREGGDEILRQLTGEDWFAGDFPRQFGPHVLRPGITELPIPVRESFAAYCRRLPSWSEYEDEFLALTLAAAATETISKRQPPLKNPAEPVVRSTPLEEWKTKGRWPKSGWIADRWRIIEQYAEECLAAGVSATELTLVSIFHPDEKWNQVDKSDFFKWLRGEAKPNVETAIKRTCTVLQPHLKNPRQ
jgi:hypothetical protein